MSNDEIKREAFKFSGLFTLQTEDGKNQMNIFLKPKRIETKLISIRHNFLPSTVIEQLEGLSRFLDMRLGVGYLKVFLQARQLIGRNHLC